MMNPFAWLQMTNMISYQGLVRTFPKATGRHGTGSPCKPPSRVQRVRSAIRDDGAAAVGTGMCRPASAALRPPRWTRRGNPRSGRFAGGKTFGVICQRERVFQKSLALARRAGEIPSRAVPSRPAWRSHANQERGKVSALRQTTKKTAAQGLRFFIGSTCWHQTPTRPTALRHGASWFCRRCLPALCPSR